MRTALLLTLLLCAGAAHAQPAETPRSPRCTQALAALDAQEAQLPASGASPALLERHAALRREAARACLGGTGTSPPPQSARPPVVVPPAGVPQLPPAPPLPAPRVPAPRPMPPPSAGAAPPLVTSCDAGGCWTSTGQYLQRAGAGLFGPRGLCSVHGRTVNCP